MAALQTGTRISGAALLTIAVVPLLYPIVDVANWQRLAVLAQETGSEPDLRSAIMRRIFNSLAAEVMLLLLLMCMLGAIAVVATQAPVDRGALPTFIGALALEESLPARLALSLLSIGMVAMALSAMSSMFSASLWTLRYDMLPALWPAAERITGDDEAIARRRTILIAIAFALAGILLVYVAGSFLGMEFTSSTFLAVLVACWCAQVSFVPLVLAPMALRDRGAATVSAPWALVIIAVAAGSGIAAVIVYVATGVEAWLWGAVPACLGSGLALFPVARLRRGHPAGR
jgi:hypothetical protein